jgi:S-DNA-T family DNA segregation ATPase FtsK/SpoIIIE
VVNVNLFKSLKDRHKLISAFKEAGIYKEVGENKNKLFPIIHNTPNEKYDYYVFTLRNGIDPKLLKKNLYVFKQFFGRDVILDGEYKRFKLSITNTKLIDKVNYDYSIIQEIINNEKLLMPIVCGLNEKGKLIIYDATNSPNLLIYGEPGSGKSSILHVILCTLIQRFKPEQIEFYLADFKMSELNLYEDVEHVKSVSYLEKDFSPVLSHLKNELTKRGQLLKEYKVRHVNRLSDNQKPPYIVLCVDEFIMIKDEGIMADLLQIASLGRAYGIYLILSMQRPSHKILSTDVRGTLSVRMGFRTVDKRNAMIGETLGSETIPKKGYEGTFYLKMDDLEQLRAPYLDENETELILSKYKLDDWKNHNFYKHTPTTNKVLSEKDVFHDVD